MADDILARPRVPVNWRKIVRTCVFRYHLIGSDHLIGTRVCVASEARRRIDIGAGVPSTSGNDPTGQETFWDVYRWACSMLAVFCSQRLEGLMVTTEKLEQVELLTISQAANVFGRTRGALHHYRLSGRLPMIRVGRKYLVSRESVEALRREREAIPSASKTAVN